MGAMIEKIMKSHMRTWRENSKAMGSNAKNVVAMVIFKLNMQTPGRKIASIR